MATLTEVRIAPDAEFNPAMLHLLLGRLNDRDVTVEHWEGDDGYRRLFRTTFGPDSLMLTGTDYRHRAEGDWRMRLAFCHLPEGPMLRTATLDDSVREHRVYEAADLGAVQMGRLAQSHEL